MEGSGEEFAPNRLYRSRCAGNSARAAIFKRGVKFLPTCEEQHCLILFLLPAPHAEPRCAVISTMYFLFAK